MLIPGVGTLVLHGHGKNAGGATSIDHGFGAHSQPMTMSQRLGQLYNSPPQSPHATHKKTAAGHHYGATLVGLDDLDGGVLEPPKVVYTVKFKRIHRLFIVHRALSSTDINVGTFVKVEADRGEDLGRVASKISADKFNQNVKTAAATRSAGSSSTEHVYAVDLKRIMSVATQEEIILLEAKREEEDALLKICRSKVKQRALPMHVVDAEYQFDRHKLTFFFEAEGRIDFRELGECHSWCRPWCRQWCRQWCRPWCRQWCRQWCRSLRA